MLISNITTLHSSEYFCTKFSFYTMYFALDWFGQTILPPFAKVLKTLEWRAFFPLLAVSLAEVQSSCTHFRFGRTHLEAILNQPWNANPLSLIVL